MTNGSIDIIILLQRRFKVIRHLQFSKNALKNYNM